ncbi:hypothetical protein DPMN_057753, partial [Dreissena polymorpha]
WAERSLIRRHLSAVFLLTDTGSEACFSSTDVDERAVNTSSDSQQSEVGTDTRRSKRKEIPRRRSQRQTRRPAWFTSGEYKL